MSDKVRLAPDAPLVEERSDRIQLRYKIQSEFYADIVCSVVSRSVLLLGVTRGDEDILLASLPLVCEIEPTKTIALYAGDELVLTLFKANGSG